jgi:predicted MFS family arabinose efflux permease
MEMGIALAIVTPLAGWLAFPAPGRRAEAKLDDQPRSPGDDSLSATLGDALGSGCFWIFALSISLFGLTTAGVSLFQQLILAERGLPESVFHVVLIIGLFAGLAANLVGGWLLRRHSMATLLAIAMFLLAGSLAALPFLRTALQAYVQGIVAGIAGGLLTVLFFAVWAPAFGPRHLGRIQSSAQMMTVLASAVGPLLVAWGREQFGSYLPILSMLAIVSAAFGFAALRVSIPSAGRGDWAVRKTPAAIAGA